MQLGCRFLGTVGRLVAVLAWVGCSSSVKPGDSGQGGPLPGASGSSGGGGVSPTGGGSGGPTQPGGATSSGGDATSAGGTTASAGTVGGEGGTIASGGSATGVGGAVGRGSGGVSGSGFVHPGILVDQAMLDFVHAKLASNAEPWVSALAAAKATPLASLTYTPHPLADVVCGSYSNPNIGCDDETHDSDAAYIQAPLWVHTGDVNYAKKAIEIMNAWSSTVTTHSDSNAPLQSAGTAEVFPRAAEIIRSTYTGWAAADIAQFTIMLKNVYLPQIIKGSDYNGNWELSMIEGIMNIAVFTDDKATFQKAPSMWRARVPAYVYMTSDGPTGWRQRLWNVGNRRE